MMAPTTVDPKETQIDALRQEQIQTLYHYDIAMSRGESACGGLCKHHTRICALATRICEIADANPDHPRGLAACRQANDTCSDVTQRLPQECWCRK